jgi:hypothetical protein
VQWSGERGRVCQRTGISTRGGGKEKRGRTEDDSREPNDRLESRAVYTQIGVS